MKIKKLKVNLAYRQAGSQKAGFTLIEMLVFLFIFSVVTIAFYAAWSVSTRYILYVKNRFSAISLASEKMEVVRNMAYDKIAHTGGDPPGNLNEDEYVMRVGREFHVHTEIVNVDDPLDGTLGGTPNDVDFVDYKNVRIEVFWENETYSVTIASRFVPPGIESSAAGLGVLVVNVYSDQSSSNVSGSTVHITNSDTGYNETRETDSFGRLILVGLSASTNKYKVVLTKSGYETVETFPPYPDTAYNPRDEHASVIEAAINPLDLIQNKAANLKIKTTDYLGQKAADINFYLKGGRELGSQFEAPDNKIYSLDLHGSTDAEGEKDFGVVSPGQYEFTFEEPGYTVVGLNKISPFSLASEQALELAVKVSPNSVTAILVKVKSDAAPIANASIHLTNAVGYDNTLTTDENGLAFFPNAANPPFAAGTYDFSITAAGHEDAIGQAVVSENNLKTEEVTMTGTP